MNFSKEDNLKRIADALERISPLPVDNTNLEKSNLFVYYSIVFKIDRTASKVTNSLAF